MIVFLNIKMFKNILIKSKCLSFNKDYSSKIEEALKKDLRTHEVF